MSGDIYQLISIIIYMVTMLVIGWYAFKFTKDYMLGERSLDPAVTALSARVNYIHADG